MSTTSRRTPPMMSPLIVPVDSFTGFSLLVVRLVWLHSRVFGCRGRSAKTSRNAG